MHVRAYNFWVSMLGGRVYPSIEALDPRTAGDFGPHSVLLDFTAGGDDPAISFLGDALRRECGLGREIGTIADVPSRSLLSRLTDHYLQIIANRAPIGFEAEFVNQRGRNTMYRGILMPYSSDDDTIDFVYGVINWKEIAAPDPVGAGVAVAANANMPASPSTGSESAIWADGPSGGFDTVADDDADDDDDEYGREAAVLADGEAGLADHLAVARDQAEAAQGTRLKSRVALYRALGLAYDFSLLATARATDYAELLADAGLRVQPRAPMTAVIKLVFGMGIDKARATEFAATLAHARRIGLGAGALADHIAAQPGGLKAMVAAERIARRPARTSPSHAEIARAALRKAAPQMIIDLASGADEFVLLLARREADGRLAVIAPVPEHADLVDRAIRKITN